jgi:hypothetical protein
MAEIAMSITSPRFVTHAIQAAGQPNGRDGPAMVRPFVTNEPSEHGMEWYGRFGPMYIGPTGPLPSLLLTDREEPLH